MRQRPPDPGRPRPPAVLPAFAGELINTAATVAGAAQALQQASAEAASVDPQPRGCGAAARTARRRRERDTGRVAGAAGPSGFRTPFREDGGTLYLIDQRRLPDALVEYPCRSAGEVAFAIREMIVRGAPAIGQVAAIGLAMSAESQARRPALRAPGDAARRARTR